MHPADPRSNLWTHTAPPGPDCPALQGERAADVAVVGGGYTGLSAALHLAEGGADVVLLEAGQPGFGASGRNNGQVIPVYSRHSPDDAVATFGRERGERLNDMVAGSADLVFDLIRKHEIDCDASQEGWLQPAHRASRMRGIQSKHDQWAARGAPVEMFDAARAAELTGSPIYHGGWMHRSGGHIQPLSFSLGLARAAQAAGAAVHGDSPVLSIDREGDKWRLKVAGGVVRAEKVILATNGYTGNLFPSLRQTIIPLRSTHLATTVLGDNVARSILPGNHGLSDTRQALWAFRKDRFGRIVTTSAPVFTTGARDRMTTSTIKRLNIAFPQIERPEIEYVWEGIIAMTYERLPRYHELAGGIIAALGYSGRGIALGTAVGRMMAERALGKPASELALPAVPLKPWPMHDLVVPFSRTMAWYFKWRDSRD
ncbi:MAG: FAD-binding oxidoreductase [Rhodospirillaceae bacterium]|jgi:glycine/D-amino acid oxidase-like deaminating enzyme|nr:FAD-binding oxidoreductase [Rhodospirillaceae bacterium]MBT5894392.1 FAD-binding oxidoreductase [Rhodospirillaceae bacterium]MBT6430204.1 FAD-binding oxidoreductase [Rhodospirillaceae bacterium]